MSRQQVKIGLVRLLYERNYSREQVIELFNIIDWMIRLPEGLAKDFAHEVYAIEEEKKVAYVNSVVRYETEKAAALGMQLGRQEGMQQGMQQGM